MKTTYYIGADQSGTLDELQQYTPVSIPSLSEVLAVMDILTFVVETVAHLRDMEELLPLTNLSRELLAKLNPSNEG